MELKQVKQKVIGLLTEYRTASHMLGTLQRIVDGSGIDDPTAKIGKYIHDVEPVTVKLEREEILLGQATINYLANMQKAILKEDMHVQKAESFFNSIKGRTEQEEAVFDRLRDVFAGSSYFEEDVTLTEVENAVLRRIEMQVRAKRDLEDLQRKAENIERTLGYMEENNPNACRLLNLRFIKNIQVKELLIQLNMSSTHFDDKRDAACMEFAFLCGLIDRENYDRFVKEIKIRRDAKKKK